MGWGWGWGGGVLAGHGAVASQAAQQGAPAALDEHIRSTERAAMHAAHYPCWLRPAAPGAPLPAGRGLVAAPAAAAGRPPRPSSSPAGPRGFPVSPALAAPLPLLLRGLHIRVPFVRQDGNVVVGPRWLSRCLLLSLLLRPHSATQPRSKLPALLRQPDAICGSHGRSGGQLPPRTLRRATWRAIWLRWPLGATRRALRSLARLWLLLMLLLLAAAAWRDTCRALSSATAAWSSPCRAWTLQAAPLGRGGRRSRRRLSTHRQHILAVRAGNHRAGTPLALPPAAPYLHAVAAAVAVSIPRPCVVASATSILLILPVCGSCPARAGASPAASGRSSPPATCPRRQPLPTLPAAAPIASTWGCFLALFRPAAAAGCSAAAAAAALVAAAAGMAAVLTIGSNEVAKIYTQELEGQTGQEARDAKEQPVMKPRDRATKGQEMSGQAGGARAGWRHVVKPPGARRRASMPTHRRQTLIAHNPEPL